MGECGSASGRPDSYQDSHYYCNWTSCGAHSFGKCSHRPLTLTRWRICICCVLSCKPVWHPCLLLPSAILWSSQGLGPWIWEYIVFSVVLILVAYEVIFSLLDCVVSHYSPILLSIVDVDFYPGYARFNCVKFEVSDCTSVHGEGEVRCGVSCTHQVKIVFRVVFASTCRYCSS